MNYTLTPKTFSVNEIFNPKISDSGRYYYYILQKKGISHSQAVKRIGAKAYFAGVKDKNASTTQWFCTQERIDEVDDEDFKVKFKGCANERIFVGAHKGNIFRVDVELNAKEAESMRHFKPKNELVCNYFGAQRFGSANAAFCKAILENDFENALRVLLTSKSKHDTPKSTAMKTIISENWGDWKKILEHEEIKGTGKVILFEYLAANPKSFESAFSYSEQKSLLIMLKAVQAQRFNEELNKLAVEKKPNNYFAQISGQFGEYALGASKAFKREITITPTDFEKKFRKTPLKRRTFFASNKFKSKRLENGEFELSFELGKGRYATIFLKFLEAWLAKKINKGLSPK